MLIVFKRKNSNCRAPSFGGCFINEKNEMKNNAVEDEYNNSIYYPFSSKEWFSSVYSYNKSYVKALISKDAVLNKLFKSYFNIISYKTKTLFRRRRNNKARYSANKIYVSRAELEHKNTKFSTILHIYNKQKSSIKRDIRKMITRIKLKEILVDKKKRLIPDHKNRLVHLIKNNYFIVRKLNMAFFKPVNRLTKHSFINFREKYFKSYKIPSYDIILLKKLFKLQKILFHLIKSIHFNKSNFNNLRLGLRNKGLIGLIEKLYYKKVEVHSVEQKALHLNSDVFSSAVALKLRDRKNKAVKILRKAILQMVNIPDLHTLITFDDNSKAMNKNNIISTIKQQVVSGVRFEASGRLTRRLTAMRAVFKYRYAGSLKNIRSSFNTKSSTMLRGHVKSNSQYTLINSKTRNGTFGLKGWVSSH